MTHTTHSPEETKRLAAELATQLHGGETLLLDGELGSGKTTFVQGLAVALGADAARSPTFSIMNVYETNVTDVQIDTDLQIKKIVHLDCYRMKQSRELEELGLEEWLGREDTLVIIEWPPKEFVAPKNSYRIRFENTNDSTREIAIEPL